MKYEDFLTGNLLNYNEVINDDKQSHYRQNLDTLNQLDEQAHVHHWETMNKIYFEPTNVVKSGTVVRVNGRCMFVAVSKPLSK